jgi:hypothetical protein
LTGLRAARELISALYESIETAQELALHLSPSLVGIGAAQRSKSFGLLYWNLFHGINFRAGIYRWHMGTKMPCLAGTPHPVDSLLVSSAFSRVTACTLALSPVRDTLVCSAAGSDVQGESPIQ